MSRKYIAEVDIVLFHGIRNTNGITGQVKRCGARPRRWQETEVKSETEDEVKSED